MNKTGYALLNKTQMEIIYGPKSPYNSTEALKRLSTLNKTEIYNGMLNDIQRTAAMKSFQLRQKDVVSYY